MTLKSAISPYLPLALIILAGVVFIGSQGALDRWLNTQNQERERLADLAYARSKQTVQQTSRRLTEATNVVDSLIKHGPKTRTVIRRDTIQIPVPTPQRPDSTPEVKVIVQDTAYWTPVPVANELDRYMKIADAIVPVIKEVRIFVPQVDTLIIRADTAIVAAKVKAGFFRKALNVVAKGVCVGGGAAGGAAIYKAPGAAAGALGGWALCRIAGIR